MSKFTEDEQRRVQEAATRLMQNMRNQYSVMQSNYDYGSYGSGPAREFGGDGYLSSAVHGNSEDARQYYQSGLVIQYDSRGVPVIRESWGFDLEETDIIGYLQQASMARLMDDNGMGDVVYDTDVYYTIIEQIRKTAQRILRLYFIRGQNKCKTSNLSFYYGQICARFQICSFIVL